MCGRAVSAVSIYRDGACTVRRLVSKFKGSGKRKIPLHKYGGGNPSKICHRNLRVIRYELKKNPSIRQIKEKNASLLQGVTVRSIYRAIRSKIKYKKARARKQLFVTEAQRMRRLEVAQKYASCTVHKWRKELWLTSPCFVSVTQKASRCGFARGPTPSTQAKHLKPSSLCNDAEHFPTGSWLTCMFSRKVNRSQRMCSLRRQAGKLLCHHCRGVTAGRRSLSHGTRCQTMAQRESEVEVIPDDPSNSPDISPIKNL